MNKENNDTQEITEYFKNSWEVFMAQGIEALEEEEVATILFHLHHVDAVDHSTEQKRFLKNLSSYLENK